MKAIILLGTLKKEGVSNTETLTSFFNSYLGKEGIEAEVIKLVDYKILPGTYTEMNQKDDWPGIFKKLTEADIIIFATPIWWGNHSSEIQRVIERLDEVHDKIEDGEESPLADKPVGIIITGDSDGSQHIIGSISNFVNAIGMFVPPFSTLSVQAEEHIKDAEPGEDKLLELYEKDYAEDAAQMAAQLKKYAE